MGRYAFPEGFEWGVATSAAQIEGAWDEGGRGPSIWDEFCKRPGAIAGGHDCSRACDHYHRFREDVALMKELGVTHYRFSISWPRILPEGRGRVNPEGVAFYRALLNELRGAGIEPAVTLFHWDLPQALQAEGGFERRQCAYDFLAYARLCFEEFGDLVGRWITLNEPRAFVLLGYELGKHAPGFSGHPASLDVAHHLLLGHGLAVQAFREGGYRGSIGLALDMSAPFPSRDTPEDWAACELTHGMGGRWYADPAIKGEYPPEVMEFFRGRKRLPAIEPGDMAIIGSGIDFLGINYYFCNCLKGSREDPGLIEQIEVGLPKTKMGWNVVPEGLRRLLGRLAKDYPGMPLYITENGVAFDDPPPADGLIEDLKRVEYLKAHLAQASLAIGEGIPLKGYYLWSFMDNFEWERGYDLRFGVVGVDPGTLERRPKRSARFYSKVMAENAVDAEDRAIATERELWFVRWA